MDPIGVEIVKVEQAQKSWVAKAWALPHQVATGAIAQVKKRYQGTKNRYGPKYTSAMLIAALLTFFLPIPGSLLVTVALIVVIAEVHRASSKRGGYRGAITNLAMVLKANIPYWATGRRPVPRG